MAHAESSILPATDLDFGYIHAFFIFGAIDDHSGYLAIYLLK